MTLGEIKVDPNVVPYVEAIQAEYIGKYIVITTFYKNAKQESERIFVGSFKQSQFNL